MLSYCSDSPVPEPPQNDNESSESSYITKYSLKRQPHGKTKQNLWRGEEDALLRDIMEKTGGIAWSEVAKLFNKYNPRPRKTKDITQHWNRVVCAEHRKWSREEDNALINAVQQCAVHNWRSISLRITGRTNNQIIARLKILRKRSEYAGQLRDEYWP